jgi:hypothetical protein
LKQQLKYRVNHQPNKIKYNNTYNQEYVKQAVKKFKSFLTPQRNIPYGEYVDHILQLCNETFTPLYSKVFKQYWHDNRFMAKMARNYVKTDWENAQYEVYIPTADNLENNLQYMRISVKVVPSVDYESARVEQRKLLKPLITPAGIVDSELLIIIAPKLKKRGFVRGYKHTKKPGYLTGVFVAKFPEQVFLRILDVLQKFIGHRIDKLLDKLGFTPYQTDYNDSKKFYYIGLYHIIERFSHVIGLMIRSFSHFLAWIHGKHKSVKHNIGLQNMARQAIKPFKRKEIPKVDRVKLVEMFKSLFNVQEEKRTVKKEIIIPEYEDPILKHLKVLSKAKPLKTDIGTRKPFRYKTPRRAKIRQHGEVTYL